MEGVGRLYLKALKYTSFLSFFMSSAVIIFARPFVALWLEPEFAEAAEVMRVLAVGSAFLVPQIIGEALLFGVDRHRLLLRALLIECILKIGLSFWLIPLYGLLGMAYAAAIPQVILYVTLYPAMIARVLKLPLAGVLMATVQSGFPAMFACVPVAILMRVALPPLGWPAFAVNAVVVSLVTLAAGWFVLAPEDRAALLSRVRSWKTGSE
jgi:O-antigen/teichoic acid export membrane protein